MFSVDCFSKIPRNVVLKAALGMGHTEEEALSYLSGLDLNGDGYLDLDELSIAYGRMSPKV